MTSTSKNVHIDKLHENVNKYNNAYHSTESDDKCDDPEFEVGDIVRISIYKNIFAKIYTARSSAENFIIKKIRNTVPWRYIISDLTGERVTETLSKKNYKKQTLEFNK